MLFYPNGVGVKIISGILPSITPYKNRYGLLPYILKYQSTYYQGAVILFSIVYNFILGPKISFKLEFGDLVSALSCFVSFYYLESIIKTMLQRVLKEETLLKKLEEELIKGINEGSLNLEKLIEKIQKKPPKWLQLLLWLQPKEIQNKLLGELGTELKNRVS